MQVRTVEIDLLEKVLHSRDFRVAHIALGQCAAQDVIGDKVRYIATDTVRQLGSTCGTLSLIVRAVCNDVESVTGVPIVAP
jgi:hypothetical protein